jgi:hypothetical protein
MPERIGVTSHAAECDEAGWLLVNRHEGLVGVVVLVCLARVVVVGGANRPHDVSATQAFADDDEYVVHVKPPVRAATKVAPAR